MKSLATVLFLLILISCSTPQKKQDKVEKSVSWAVQMADAVITRYDSLIYYTN